MYPEIKKVKLPRLNFPTAWQAVIFRNYGFVPTERIAAVLGCSAETVKREAVRLGLKVTDVSAQFLRAGYLTIIRNNWYLLNIKQLKTLLDFSQEKLEYVLKEEDFLYVKLGGFKPDCPEVCYVPLREEEREQTEEAKKFLEQAGEGEGTPFAFFPEAPIKSVRQAQGKTVRMIHGYLSPCGNVFSMDGKTYLDDRLLAEYARVGINGVWLHALLSTLSPYPFCEALSQGYETRRKNLNALIDRCKEYGIKVYLYFNEPRCLSLEKFGKNRALIGHRFQEMGALCLGHEEVREYLYRAVYSLLQEVKDLGGIVTITMSENLTHCRSLGATDCECCKKKSAYGDAVLVNNIIYRAARDSGSSAEVIANVWGWAEYMGWSQEDTDRAIAALDRGVSVMCVSEFDLEIEKAGVKSRVKEYSLSNVGPSKITAHNLKTAKETGHKLYAKIQANNSWECSAVPCLPVFDLVYRHLSNLKELGVENYMLSWTLGGYPSPALDLVRAFSEGVLLEEWYRRAFGGEGERVHEAVKCFCAAFENYPFSMEQLYYSPVTLGYANLWDSEPDEKTSCMVCYCFDDVESYLPPYSAAQYLALLEALLTGWRQGIKELASCKRKEAQKLLLFAKAAYLHFKADYNQTLYSLYKREPQKNRGKLRDVLRDTQKDVLSLIQLQRKNAAIGFEASNHYLYTVRNLKEKLLNCRRLEKE